MFKQLIIVWVVIAAAIAITAALVPSVEVDGRQFEASAAIAQGPERDRLWQQHLEAQPQLAAHAEQAGRTIPMVRLTPR